MRSFSVQNNLSDKITTLKSNNNTNNNAINSSVLNCSTNNMNSSFDNVIGFQNQNKKIKIPKLNLEILPNYHGRSNKSLNQSLMDNYSKAKPVANANQWTSHVINKIISAFWMNFQISCINLHEIMILFFFLFILFNFLFKFKKFMCDLI